MLRSRAVTTRMQREVTKRPLWDKPTMRTRAATKRTRYAKFWKAFGKYIKMGLIEDAANRTRLAKLLRYATSKSGDKEISLEDYVANMKENQKHIYYISGEDRQSLLKSPSVEKLLSRDMAKLSS